MKRIFKRLTCLTGVLCMLVTMFTFLAAPAMADATRVVTLGQDLSDEQEAFIVNYFGADLSTARVIYVNNWQEREILGSWIPLEQIGNITISSAYVQPTNSGGIQVRTANLTYVTGNMIASVLSTAGITNCNVVAAAPFPVSGTGALTGVMIAYQAATGEELDNTKRDLAVQEFTVTQQTSGSIGENEALQLVNAVKMEVLQSDVPANDTQQIAEIVDQVVADMDQSLAINGNGNQIDSVNMDQSVNVDNSTYYDYSVSNISSGLSADDRQMLIDLASKIAEQDYDKEAILETLERVNDNLADKTNIEINVSNGNNIDNASSSTSTNNNDNDSTNNNNSSSSSDTDTVVDDADSIFNDLNVGELSADVQSATDEAGMAQIQEQMQEEAEAAGPTAAEDPGFSIMNEETYVLQPEVPEAQQSEIPTPVEEVAPEPEEPVMPEYVETIVPEPEQTEEPVMPEYVETVVPEPEQPEQPEEPVMPEYVETIVPEPEQPEEPVMPEYVETFGETEQSELTEPSMMMSDGNEPDEQFPEQVEQTEEPVMPESPEEDMVTEPVDAGGAASLWQVAKVPDGQTLRSDVQAVWDTLETTTFEGVTLTPAVYLGSQEVAGLNYEILCTGSPADMEGADAGEDLYIAIMYESLEGAAEITSITRINLDELAAEQNEALIGAPLAGGWQFSQSIEDVPSAMDQVAASVFGALLETYPEKNLTPVMLLATKQTDVVQYAVLCYEMVEGTGGYYEVAFASGDPFGYITEASFVPLDLAKYNS